MCSVYVQLNSNDNSDFWAWPVAYFTINLMLMNFK